MSGRVRIVGGGLAGCEAALQLAARGVEVDVVEMRPQVETGAHRSDQLAEIVCTNSFKSTLLENASGLLKAEMEILGCRLLGFAKDAAVPAGHALAVDRDVFSTSVTEALEAHPAIRVVRECQRSLDMPRPSLIATGPLTGSDLSVALQEHCSSDHLYFYDAIAPSVAGDSVDVEQGYWASRYDKGEADYFNIPLDRDQYKRLIEQIRAADLVRAHAFEDGKYFEACLPVEVMAARGEDTLRFGPLKPRGLPDPRTGREPYAAIQLRQESRTGNLLGLVGFQTRMTYAAQKEILQTLPSLGKSRILRYGSIHRNIFLDLPSICGRYQRDRRIDGLFYAGQICGVEGYVECIMSGMVAAISIHAHLQGTRIPALPTETMIGGLMNYIHTPNKNFQPMNANMGIVPMPAKTRIRNRKERYRHAADRALGAMRAYRAQHPWLFDASAEPGPDRTFS